MIKLIGRTTHLIRHFSINQNIFKIDEKVSHQRNRFQNKNSHFFSTGKDTNNDNKNDDKNKDNGVSLQDVWQKIAGEAKSVWIRAKLLTRNQWIALAGIAGLIGALYLTQQSQVEEYPMNYFEDDIGFNSKHLDEIDAIMVVTKLGVKCRIQFTNEQKRYSVNYNNNIDRFNNILSKVSKDVKIVYKYKENYEIWLSTPTLLAQIISVVCITAFFLRSTSMSTGGIKKNNKQGMMNQILGNKKSFQVITNTGVRFKDVAGLDQSKIEVKEFVDFLKNPQKYKKLGARIPKGVLLSGPPGTGKTMLAKACAGQAGVPFIPTSGSDFVEIFVGVGASRVRDLFAAAKEKSPSIIFIDEIDAVGRKRSGSHGSHDERDNTLNQILVQMDGFETDQNVIVMAATNRQNLLDTALIRPGRFDRIVQVNLPDLQGRRQIFNVHLQRITVDSSRSKDEYARRLASLTPSFSGADIANLCNEAAILAARHNKPCVDAHDFQMATQRIIGGIQKKGIISTQQKRIIAVHQSGHAVVSWFLEGANPLLKLTIIPRSKGSLGFAQYFANQNKLNTKSELIDQMCFILGGRCAEQLFYGTITNGAADDLKKVYEIAHSIIVKLGMNDIVGNIGFRDPQYLRTYSDEMGGQIDREVMKLISECTERTRQMVKKHEHHIKALSDELFQKQTLTIKQIRKILGERDFTTHESYNKYLQIQKQDKIAAQTAN